MNNKWAVDVEVMEMQTSDKSTRPLTLYRDGSCCDKAEVQWRANFTRHGQRSLSEIQTKKQRPLSARLGHSAGDGLWTELRG